MLKCRANCTSHCVSVLSTGKIMNWCMSRKSLLVCADCRLPIEMRLLKWEFSNETIQVGILIQGKVNSV